MHFKDSWGLSSSCILHTTIYDHCVTGMYLHSHQVYYLMKRKTKPKQPKSKPTILAQ